LGLASNGYNGGVPPTSPQAPERLRLKADLTLLLVALVWGSAFVAQRVAALSMGVYLFNGLRFLLGVLVLLPLALRTRRDAAGIRASLPGMLLAGLLLFGGTSLQQLGLRYTTAANAGFITGLYVVLVPLLLALGWRQPPRRVVWLAAALSAAGLFLLSTGGSFSLKLGDALELAGAFLWAFHVLCIGWLVQRADVLHISVVQCTVCGLLSLGMALALESGSLSQVSGAWWTVIYTGLLSIGLAYTLQGVGQKVAPPADAAILLSLEAVFAALAGWLFLDERLSAVQLLGCALMLGGMLLAQVPQFFRGRSNPGTL
jgi:drug/metabolite transporter (DMT)-like permease